MAKLLNALSPNSGAEFLLRSIDVILFNELGSPGPGEAAGITESPSMKLLRELRPKLLSHCPSLTPRRSYMPRVRHGRQVVKFFGWFSGKNKS